MRHCSVPKLQPNEKRLYLKFTRPEDLDLYARIEKDASDTTRRYDMATYILLLLHAALPVSDTNQANLPESQE